MFYNRLMEERVSRLHGQLQRIQQAKHTMSPGAKDVHTQCSVLNSINEDLHWLMLVAGKSCYNLAVSEPRMYLLFVKGKMSGETAGSTVLTAVRC